MRDHPEAAEVVAIAEPREDFRRHAAGLLDVGPDAEFTGWQELAEQPRLADVAIVATLDDIPLEGRQSMPGTARTDTRVAPGRRAVSQSSWGKLRAAV